LGLVWLLLIMSITPVMGAATGCRVRYPSTNGEGLDRHGKENFFFWLA
jgi:hypothetical protein